MNDLKNPFIDFYNRHNIIPVSQDISDIDRHFQRRNALYRHCGIPSLLIKGRTVIEIGPGTGHNALYTNSLQPEKYVLVDGAKESIANLTHLFSKFFSDTSNCEIIESSLDQLKLDQTFDIVLCEGAIPFQKNPADFLKRIARFAGPSGVVLITCADAVSYFSEVLRRIMALLILGEEPGPLEITEKLEKLRPVFAGHLCHLKGMSRSVDDWIYDNILQPFIGEPFSIAQAVDALGSEFDVYGASPQMFTDWRWYKDIYGRSHSFNPLAIETFWQNVHNLIDYRRHFDASDKQAGMEIMNLCNTVFDLSIQLQNSGLKQACLKQVKTCLHEAGLLVSGFSTDTVAAISEFEGKIAQYLSGHTPDFTDMPAFSPWFGRGQQYLSFIRKSK